MWLKFLLSRPVSIASFHWAPKMESGSSSPSVKSFEVAGLSTNNAALAVAEEVSSSIKSPHAASSIASNSAVAAVVVSSHTSSKIRKSSPIAETKAAIAQHIASTTTTITTNSSTVGGGGGGGGGVAEKYRTLTAITASSNTITTATTNTTTTTTTLNNNQRGNVNHNHNNNNIKTTPRSPSCSYAVSHKKSLGPSKFRNLICTTGTERLNREFRDVKCSGMPQVRELKLCDNNLFHWKFLLLPDMAPYNKNAFQAEIKFPTSYPQMAPIITVHNIYHPNVDEKGFVCLHCLSHWTRTTKIEDVLQKLFALIRDPEPHHPMRFDVADEYLKDRKVFMHKAFEAAKAFGVPRPKF